MRGTHCRVLLTVSALAVLTAIFGALDVSRPEAFATSSIRQMKTTTAAGRTTRVSGPTAPPTPRVPADRTVDLFGDSLGYQAEPYLDMFFGEARGYTVTNNTYGGTATATGSAK